MSDESLFAGFEGMRMSVDQVVELAVEALRRSGYGIFAEGGHPEDIVAGLTPALEAVAVGYSEGYRRGRKDGKTLAAWKEKA